MKTELPDHRFDEIVAIDLEIHPVSKDLLAVSAIRPGEDAFKRIGTHGDPQSVLQQFGEYADGSRFVLGHNIVFYDLPWLKAHDPANPLNGLPAIDTLLLSPLAFPKHPYHRLWKGYKPTDSSRNDPFRDSQEALGLFVDQLSIFEQDPYFPVYLNLLARDTRSKGCAEALTVLTGIAPLTDQAALKKIREGFADKVCLKQLPALFSSEAGKPADWISMAMAVSWLSVAGTKSRLAPWVVHTFPQTVGVLNRLRQQACHDCLYCLTHHSPDEALKRYFGFSGFRTVIEKPLIITQKVIVESILNDQDCMVVLPTGGGKSLCYQLPALMRARQRNLLTLVITPLQSLMKDQVDALAARGLENVGVLNSQLSLFERAETLEKISMGEIDILWVAPEQMRNKSFLDTISQRELGLVVVDEAHCLSKWGHDFRPDYLFLCSFLKEVVGPGTPLPQIACFTATAKTDVIEEISGFFWQEAGKELVQFIGSSERANLNFHVHGMGGMSVCSANPEEYSKLELVQQILKAGLASGGGAILFTATRKGAEQLASHLQKSGFSADFFHAGRTPDDKRRVQEMFLTSKLQVMCATNAFGMGVDKANVRVVIHMEVPGSLENYLQEAGRAGRDQKDAQCHLLFSAKDLELQFQLSMDSRIGYGDLVGIFRGIRNLAKKQKAGTGQGEIVRTTGEILREEETKTETIDAQDSMADTKVKIAIAWLEKLNRLERSWNRTSVIEAKPVPTTLDAAMETVRTLSLPPHAVTTWGRLLQVLYQANVDDLLNTDALSSRLGETAEALIKLLREMRQVGLITHAVHCSALFNNLPQKPNDSFSRWDRFCRLETLLLKHLEIHEDWASHETNPLDIRVAATSFSNETGLGNVSSSDLYTILKIWRRDKSISYVSQGYDRCSLTRQRNPAAIGKFIRVRQQDGRSFIDFMRTKCPAQGLDRRVEFTVEELESVLSRSSEQPTGSGNFAAVKSVLLSLEDAHSLTIQKGLSVFRPALTLKLRDERQPTALECRTLEDFFDEKVAQIHVMGQYAELGRENIGQALTLVRDYFTLPRQEFYDMYFHRRKEMLHLPTGEESLAMITGKSARELAPEFTLSPAQQAIVTEGKTRNILILAGPGSGKTKSLVHRAAWLVRVQRVPWGGILIVAFNRSTVLEIRRRLRLLLGNDSGRIIVCTYHGLALRITSRSMTIPRKQGLSSVKDDLNGIVKEAVISLEEVKGEVRDAMTEGLISRVRYILVDEYQDINEDQFRMIALLARKDEPETEREVRLLAVGDDDQNIYAWSGSDVRFIRQFETDYQPVIHRLLTNFRSSEPITKFCQRFIQRLPDRLKDTDLLESAKKGMLLPENVRVPVVVSVGNTPTAANSTEAQLDAAILGEVDRWRSEGFAWDDIAILAFQNADLFRLKFLLERGGISTHLIKRMELSLLKVREIYRLAKFLGTLPDVEMSQGQFNETVASGRNPQRNSENPWENLIDHLVKDYLEENRKPTPRDFLHFISDVGRELRIGELRRPGRVALVTMHAAKGLEFPAVIVVPEGLKARPDDHRVAYVAMTRAEKALSIVAVPSPGSLAQEFFKHEKPQVWSGTVRASFSELRVWELGMKDVYLSFAGRDKNHDCIARTIAGLEYESVARMEGPVFKVGDTEVCRLSKDSQEKLTRNFQGLSPTDIRCHAIIHRSCSDETLENQRFLRRDDWEIPLFRIIFSKDERNTSL